MARWLNVATDELHFGPSTSQNTYVLAQAFRRHLQRGDEVIVTNQDHEANIGAWSRLQDDGIVVRTWQVDSAGALHIPDLEALLGARTRLVAFTHSSNAVGTDHPCVKSRIGCIAPGHWPSWTASVFARMVCPMSRHSAPTSTCSRSTRSSVRTWVRCTCAKNRQPHCPRRPMSSRATCSRAASRLPGRIIRR